MNTGGTFEVSFWPLASGMVWKWCLLQSDRQDCRPTKDTTAQHITLTPTSSLLLQKLFSLGVMIYEKKKPESMSSAEIWNLKKKGSATPDFKQHSGFWSPARICSPTCVYWAWSKVRAQSLWHKQAGKVRDARSVWFAVTVQRMIHWWCSWSAKGPLRHVACPSVCAQQHQSLFSHHPLRDITKIKIHWIVTWKREATSEKKHPPTGGEQILMIIVGSNLKLAICNIPPYSFI